MKKIAVINDLSGLGKCSLTAAIPVISAMGVQACPLPTAVLSNQTGYTSYYCDDYTDRMEFFREEWAKRGFAPDGIYTGFLAGEHQADEILRFFDSFCTDAVRVLVDPVMGDAGHAFGFLTEGFLNKMRMLVQRAWLITPNLTEAMLLLYGKEGMEKRWSALKGLHAAELKADVEMLGMALCEKFSLKSLVITGVDYIDAEQTLMIGNLVLEGGKPQWVDSTKVGGSYSGTGDLFASVLSAGMAKGWTAAHSAKKAVRFLENAIRDALAEGTDRNEGVCFEPHLHLLWEA